MNHGKNICKQLNLSEEREQSKKRFVLPSRGKVLCEALKEVRRRIAEENDIPLEIKECTYKGECLGTCPRCEAEVQYLEKSLAERIKLGKVATVAGLALGLAAPGAAVAQDTISMKEVRVTSERPNIIGIRQGEGFMGLVSDDPKKMESLPVDTLPMVLPIHKSVSLNATGVKRHRQNQGPHQRPRWKSCTIRQCAALQRRRGKRLRKRECRLDRQLSYCWPRPGNLRHEGVFRWIPALREVRNPGKRDGFHGGRHGVETARRAAARGNYYWNVHHPYDRDGS